MTTEKRICPFCKFPDPIIDDDGIACLHCGVALTKKTTEAAVNKHAAEMEQFLAKPGMKEKLARTQKLLRDVIDKGLPPTD